jgi:phosphoribosyl-ATP pyrophosphohydrolase/phosphoribosyl-AMP cyclohydrolase
MVIASIDLMNGKAVQLWQGREKVFEHDDPLALAKEFNRFGETAVIDLDAAMNKGDNCAIIKELIKFAECRVGGGIRNAEKAAELISLGVRKVIIGSKAFENGIINGDFLKALLEKISRHKVIIAIDSLNGEIVTKGWRHKTGLRLFDTVNELEKYASEFLFTCVEKEGTMTGIDMKMVRELVNSTKNRITVAGGVCSMDEIRELAQLGVGVQLGMALYTKKLNLADAFIESLNWKNGLIPTITQDGAGQVLMLAYSNRESLKKTFETGKMWYYSRSRSNLWMKGESSRNMQDVLKLRADCDRDAVLATVRQRGVACHTGSYSCFGDKEFSHVDLYELVKDRIENPRAESYTARLTDDLLKEKILEEAKEIVGAGGKDEIIWETADLLYFLTVLLAKNNIEIHSLFNELRRRRYENKRGNN